MNNHNNTQFVLLLSPAGGGKTTLIKNSVPALHKGGQKVAIIFNDDGDPDAVDMPNDVRRFADLETMTSGCFGCEDVDTLVETLQRLDGVVNTVFVEPIGFTSAGEMLNAFGQAGINPFVVTLVDAEHLEANLRIGTLDGQVAAANTVLITKANEDNFDAARAYVETLKGIGVPVHMHAIDSAYDYGFEKLSDHHDHSACLHGHHHGHDHDHGTCSHGHHHGHDHVHIVPRHHRLMPEVTLEGLQLRLRDQPAIRAKGKVGAARFSMVHGEWSVEEGDPNQPSFVTFYTVNTEEADQVDAELEDMTITNRYASMGTADETRDHSDDGSLLQETMERCETQGVTFAGGHPVANPEWQELLNEIRKRPGVSEEDQTRAVQARVRHLLDCGDWYLQNNGREDGAPWGVLHAIAVGIAWFCSEQPERVGHELISRAKRMPIVRWLANGLLGRRKTNSDLGREEVMADEAGITARWGRDNCVVDDGDLDTLKSAYQHCLAHAENDGRESVISGWQEVASSFV